jgi:hypothetical protein
VSVVQVYGLLAGRGHQDVALLEHKVREGLVGACARKAADRAVVGDLDIFF